MRKVCETWACFLEKPSNRNAKTQQFRAQDPKYRTLSTTSKVYEEVLAPHPPMLEALRIAGFRHKDGDESHLTLLHRYCVNVWCVVWLGTNYASDIRVIHDDDC